MQSELPERGGFDLSAAWQGRTGLLQAILLQIRSPARSPSGVRVQNARERCQDQCQSPSTSNPCNTNPCHCRLRFSMVLL